MKTFRMLFVFVGILVLVAAPARSDWDVGTPAKWVQLPDLATGMDVNATFAIGSQGPILHYSQIVADDFQCTATGPITGIHIWGSWLNDTPRTNGSFTLSIYADVPGDAAHFSHPGALLWTQGFGSNAFQSRVVATGNESFYDPSGLGIIGTDTQVWQYNFAIPEATAFVQQGSAANPMVYWLGAQAQIPGVEKFGWKTSLQHWNDDATFSNTQNSGGQPVAPWSELNYPIDGGNAAGYTYHQGDSIDLAFAITTVPEPGTIVLLVTGLVGLLAYAWQRRKRLA